MLRVYESFDDFVAVEDMQTIGWLRSASTAGTIAPLAAGGVAGGPCASGTLGTLTKSLGFKNDAGREIRASFFFRTNTPGSPSATVGINMFALIMDGTALSGAVTLDIMPSGVLRMDGSSNAGGQKIGTTVINDANWHHIELGWRYGTAAVGRITLYVDGVQQFDEGTFSNVESTSYGSVPYTFRLYGIATVGSRYDDLLIWDDIDNGDGFIGHQPQFQIDTLRPVAAGDLTQGTPSSGANHEAVLSPGGPTADTTFVTSIAPGITDLYQMADLPVTPTSIRAVIADGFFKGASVTEVSEVDMLVKSGATLSPAAPIAVVSVSNRLVSKLLLTDPATGVAWTPAAVNALQAGFQKVS